MADRQTNAVEELRELAGMLEFAGCLVHDEPNAETMSAWAEDGLFDSVPSACDDEAIADGLARMGAWVHEASGRCVLDEACARLGREWLRVFVGVGEPEAPSWANYYSDPEHRILGRETVQVRRAYRTFGLRLSDLNAEPDDNLGLMLRFLGHLVALEAQAVEANDDDRAGEMRVTQVAFVRPHVLPWISRWRYEGEKHAREGFYQGAVSYVFGLVRWYARGLGFEFKPQSGAFSLRAA